VPSRTSLANFAEFSNLARLSNLSKISIGKQKDKDYLFLAYAINVWWFSTRLVYG
jgi:hypothetical protein